MSETIKRIAIGGDHAGFSMKEYIKQKISKLGYEFEDFGPYSDEKIDYPDVAHPLAKSIQSGNLKFGILICGSGNGVAMVANKYPNIRAAVCWNEEITKLARMHNDANIITLPARFITLEEAVCFVTLFLTTEFEGGRHIKRIEKIAPIM